MMDMPMSFRDDLYDVWLPMISFLILIAFIVCMLNYIRQQDQEACVKQYGSQYVARGGYYAPVVCVNTDGGVKYLR